MDWISSLPPVKVESLPISTPTPPPFESSLTKQKQPETTYTNTVDIPPPPFINSINEIRSLSTALSTFLRHYDELHNHLNLIKSSIDSKLSKHLLRTANSKQSTLTPSVESSCTHAVPEATVSEQNPNVTASNRDRSDACARKPVNPNYSKNPEETDKSQKHEEIDNVKKLEESLISKKPEEIDTLKKQAVSELESLCKRMSVRDMKKYVSTHISDIDIIREELPKALKLAKDPAKLVLDSIGKFFKQGRKAFSNQLTAIARLASILILECFVMMSCDCTEITEKHQEYAAEAASDWKKRMIKEGELNTAHEVDARGLLLLISGFGIPESVFGNKDLIDLIKASNVKGISTALCRSTIFITKVPELIDWMVKQNMEIEAADLAYTLELEDKCHPQTILTAFFNNKIKDTQHTSLDQIKQQLSELKSLSKCLETHNIDPSNIFPGFKINEKIQQLEKESETLELKLKATPPQQKQKRKPEPKPHETKRSRLNMTRQQIPYPTVEPTGGYRGPESPNLGGPHRYIPQPSLGQICSSSSQQSSSVLFGTFGIIESFPGLPDPANRGPITDLYGFADKVLNAAYGDSSRTLGPGSTRYF